MDARLALVLAVVGLTAACGSEPAPIVPEPVEFAELCGERGPVRMLRFEPWREVEYAWVLATLGERRLVLVNYADTMLYSSVLWSVGLCGEQPRLMTSGGWYTFPRYDQLFVCDSNTGQLLVLDPAGVRAPRAVFQAPGSCFVRRTEAGLIAIMPHGEGSETGTLTLQRWPDDIWTDVVEPELLLDIKTFAMDPLASEWDAVQGEGPEFFVVTPADELVRVSSTDGSTELIATDVRHFELGYEAIDAEPGYAERYLVWQRTELTNDNPELPEGEILLLDLVTGEQTTLGATTLSSATNWSMRGLLQLPFRVEEQTVLRLFELPSLSSIDVPGDVRLRGRFADGRLAVSAGVDSHWAILDMHTGTLEPLSSTNTYDFWHEQQGLAVLHVAEESLAEGELWLVRGDDSPALLAERATRSYELLPDGRLLSGVNLEERDSEVVGDLIVIDPETLEERLIDREVYPWGSRSAGEDLVSYAIREGERAGVWLARLPPRE